MAKLLVYYAHPAHRRSRVNSQMFEAANTIADVTVVDLYARYPRFDINVDEEQKRLLEHDIILFQFPLFWYSTPSLIKEWCDLVLEYGFAYGVEGRQLEGKSMLLSLTAAGSEDAYTTDGYQHFSMRTFLTPLEQTATLCHMRFVPPYVLFSSLSAPDDGNAETHIAGFQKLIAALQQDRFDFTRAESQVLLNAGTLDALIKHGEGGTQ